MMIIIIIILIITITLPRPEPRRMLRRSSHLLACPLDPPLPTSDLLLFVYVFVVCYVVCYVLILMLLFKRPPHL